MTTKLKHAPLGSISHGTLREEDLLETFFDTLEGLVFINGEYFCLPENFGERDRLSNLIGEAQDCWSEDGTTLDQEKQDIIDELINESLPDALESFAPEYCYFGTHQGDGSDFGFWLCWESVDELPNVEDSDEAKELGEDCKKVNDHGNLTIYGGDGSVILSVV